MKTVFALVVHTGEFEAAVRAAMDASLVAMHEVAVADAREIVALGAAYSPVASGQMRDNFQVFSAEVGGQRSEVSFGIAQGLRAHEVRFERGDRVRVHTHAEAHVFPDGSHCSSELVERGGLEANAQARRRPLSAAMVMVWGAAPENNEQFVEGRKNVVEFGTVGPDRLIAKLEAAVVGVVG